MGLSIIDRSEDFFEGHGNHISCLQIEEVLPEFDELVETIIIGIPDDVLGEAVQAFFVPRIRGSSEHSERMTSLCNSRLVSHHLRKQNVVLSALSRAASALL